MKTFKFGGACLVGLGMALGNLAWAADSGSLSIISPKAGAVLPSGSESKLEYNLHLSQNGSHLHVYVDEGNPIIVRNVSGCPCSMTLPALSPGKHTILIKEATSGHSPTGVESSVTVTVR